MSVNQYLTEFNRAYDEYTQGNCTLTSTTEDCLNKITSLKTAYNNVSAEYSEYESESIDLMNTYNDIKSLQNELHADMKELNKAPDSLYAEHQSSYDSAIYMNIIATVLATSLLYFVFVKLE